MSSWKRDAASGLVVLTPIFVTAYLVAWLYWQLANLPVLNDVGSTAIRVLIILLLFISLSFSIGYLTRTTVGSLTESSIDKAMNYLPGLRIVYNASKMAVETAISSPDGLQQPVKVETWEGLQMTAFKTGTRTSEGDKILFIPTSPNPTTGFVVETDPDEIIELDESVEDALTRVLSCGFGETDERAIPIGSEENQ